MAHFLGEAVDVPAVTVDAPLGRIGGALAHVLAMLRPFDGGRRARAPEVALAVAQEAETRVRVANDAARELRLFEE